MKDLIKYIAQALVDYPEQVSVTAVEGDRTLVIELRVAREDIAKVIGRQGRHAEAMRTVLSAASAKLKKRSVLEIIEEADDRDGRPIPTNQVQSKTGALQAGIVKWFDDKRGYGFIEKDDGGDVFVHHSAVSGSGFKTLSEGDRVTFDEEKGEKGPKAANVTKV